MRDLVRPKGTRISRGGFVFPESTLDGPARSIRFPWRQIDAMLERFSFTRRGAIVSCSKCTKRYRVNGFSSVSVTLLAGHAGSHSISKVVS